MTYIGLPLFNISDEQFQQLIEFAIFDGAITKCNCFEENGTQICLITTFELNPSKLESPQKLKDELFSIDSAKAYLTGLLRGRINGRVSTRMAFDLNSGWHRVDFDQDNANSQGDRA
jgi:hypothetical protein